MAKYGPFLYGGLKINGVDLSNRVESLTLDLTKNDIDLMAMGDGGHVHTPSLEDDKITANFWQDYSAPGSNSVDATLMPIFQAGTAVAYEVVPDTRVAISATNPLYSGSVVLEAYQPVNGKVGDGLQTQVTFQGQGTVTRATSGTF